MIDFGTTSGPRVPPGTYTVRLISGKDSLTRSLSVIADPRVKSTAAELAEQYAAALRIRDRITEITENSQRTEDIQGQIDKRVAQAKDQVFAKRVDSLSKDVRGKFEKVREELYEIGCHVDQCTLDMPIKLYNMFISLNMQVQTGDYPPTKQHGEVFNDLNGKLQVQLQRLQALEANELAALNKLLQEVGLPPVYVAPRKVIS